VSANLYMQAYNVTHGLLHAIHSATMLRIADNATKSNKLAMSVLKKAQDELKTAELAGEEGAGAAAAGAGAGSETEETQPS